jgi:hypothetical protein
MKARHNFLSSEVLVSVTNYDFSDNADHLKRQFKKCFPTILVDSQSPYPPKTADFIIKNDYYPGLWNASVKHAIDNKFRWLMFVASDLQIKNVSLLCRRAHEVIRNDKIGSWTPSLKKGSRASFTALFNKDTDSIRECVLIEGFFFLSRVELLVPLYPIDQKNIYGWGVDVASCYLAFKSQMLVVVDDRIEIFHPESLNKHKIDDVRANEDWNNYLGSNVARWSMAVREIFR